MAQLGVTPSFFVGHVFYWGDRHRDIFLGPDRAGRISPLASALRHRLRWTVHNDTPVTPVHPLHLVWVAVNRVTSSGQVLGKDEAISVLDALRTITSEAAWQNFEEKDRGSLEPGKLAPSFFPTLGMRNISLDPVLLTAQRLYSCLCCKLLFF